MSSIDERIVKMVFDNSSFEHKIASTITSLTKLNQTTEQIGKDSGGGLSSLSDAFTKTEITATQAGFHIQDVWLKMASILEYQIAGKIVNTGKKIASALTVEGIGDGFKEYELKMGSIQTIMAGTGESLSKVNGYLNELNTYSDKTIYSFADMTNNIGKFTNAGVKLNDAVAAIKGIANEAAISGANAQEASRAMYNFSQALSAGYVKLIDWKSIENANMATKGFKDTLLEVASTVGTVEKQADGMYKVLTTNAQGKTMDDLVSGTKNFNDSLQQQWMTTEVLTRALKIYATDVRDMTDAEKAAYEEELKGMGMTDEQIKKFEELGSKATDAASEIKTFSMMIDTLKEAIGSGWAQTWETFIGDFEEGKKLWTEIGNTLSDVIGKMSDSRNFGLDVALRNGFESMTSFWLPIKDIPDSADALKAAFLDVGVATGKLSQEQADEIETVGDLVESFHKLGWATKDVVKAAVEDYADTMNNLTEEEKEAIGITDQQIESMNRSVDTFLQFDESIEGCTKQLNELGGREKLIEALMRSFEALGDVFEAISEAAYDVFGDTNAWYEVTSRIVDGIYNFSQKLKPAPETLEKIGRAAKGFFSIINMGISFIKAFTKVFTPLGGTLSDIGDILLTVAANIGDFFTDLNKYTEENQTFEKLFSYIAEGLDGVALLIDTVVEAFKSFFETLDGGTPSMDKFGDAFESISHFISNGMKNLTNRLGALKPILEGLGAIFTGLAKVVGDALKHIGDSITGFAGEGSQGFMGRLVNTFNAFMVGGSLYSLINNIKNFSAIGDIFSGIGDTLSAFQKKVGAESLKTMAEGIALLAGSIFLLAMVDSNKLTAATTAIGTMIGVLTGAIGALMKAVNSFSTSNVTSVFQLFGKDIFGINAGKMIEMSAQLSAISKALIAMGVAVLLVSIGLSQVAKVAEGGHLWESFAVVSLILLELTGVVLVLSNFGGKAKVGANGLLTITGALLIMAIALQQVADVVATGNATEALQIISIMLLELTTVMLLLQTVGGYKVGSCLGVIAIAVALNLVVIALKSISDALGEEGNHIAEALAMVTIILGVLAVVCMALGVFGGGALLGGVGAIAAAAALLIVVQSLKQVNDLLSQTDNHVWQSLGVIAAALGILAVGMAFMVGALPGAAALVVASAALIALSVALKMMGGMDLASIGKALLAMGGSLAILAVGLTAMIVALPGAVALTVAAAGLLLLGAAMNVFANMDMLSIASALGAFTSILLGMAPTMVILGVLSPLIIAFGIAVTALGVALLAVGVGLTVFSAGLQALVDILPMGAVALDQLINKLNEWVPKLAEMAMDTLATICNKIIEYKEPIFQATISIIDIVLRALSESSLKIAQTILDLLVKILEEITKKIPVIAKAGSDMMIAFMDAIGKEIPRIVNKAYEVAIALINGLADTIRNNNPVLIEAVNNLMDAVIQAIMQWLVEFTGVGKLMPEEMKNGIMDGSFNVKDAWDELVGEVIDKLKAKYEDFKEAAHNLIDGFVAGLKDTWAGKAVTEAANFAQGVVNGMNSKKGFNSHSPSRKGIESGKNLLKGVIVGIQSLEGEADAVAAGAGGKLANALDSAMELVTDLADNSMDMNPVITPVLDLTTFKKDAGSINGMLDLSRPLALADNVSMGFNANVSPMSGLEAILSKNSNTDVVNAIRDLNNNLADAMGTMSRLQVVMDTGTLVGSIAAPMDSALGRMQTMKERGI